MWMGHLLQLRRIFAFRAVLSVIFNPLLIRSAPGTDVTFDPGTYIFDGGEIWFRAGSQAEAKGVTLVLKGVDSKIFVEKESTFYIKAPIAGEFAGLAIFQDAASVQGARHFPTGASELTGGSQMTIVGTVYLPTQKIEIWGNSQFSSTSPATSYIGYDVAMGKQSQLTVNVDHESAGLPPSTSDRVVFRWLQRER